MWGIFFGEFQCLPVDDCSAVSCDSGALARGSVKLVNFCVAILILKMEEKEQHFWHIMLYHFKKGKNATGTQKKICALYGEGAVTDQTCQK